MKHFFTLYLLQDGDSSSDYVSGDSVQLADTPAETAETKSADKPKVTYSLSHSIYLYPYLSFCDSLSPRLLSARADGGQTCSSKSLFRSLESRPVFQLLDISFNFSLFKFFSFSPFLSLSPTVFTLSARSFSGIFVEVTSTYCK